MDNSIRLLKSVTQLQPNDRSTLMVYVSGFMSPGECRRAIELSRKYSGQDGLTGTGGDKQRIRNSTVRFLLPTPDSEWLFAKIEAAVLHLNQAYKFDLRGFYEGMQVASYDPEGHYDWHSDLGTGAYSVRKLSLSVQLSDTDDYEGGELEFMAGNEPAPKKIGSLVAFPSFLVHRVRPVTRGNRMSLVSWISGPPFT